MKSTYPTPSFPIQRIRVTFFLLLAAVCMRGHLLHAQTSSLNDSFSFSADGMECIISEDDLPRPWLNRLSNDVFFSWVTHNGYIESFLLDPAINGLVNPQNVSGRFYVKDKGRNQSFLVNESSGEDSWRSVIGLGYSQIRKTEMELDAKLTYFIPRNDNVLLVLAEITNTSDEPREVSVYGQVEWSLGDVTKKDVHPSDGLGGSQHNLYKKVFRDENVLIAEQTNWRSTAHCEPWPYLGFLTTDSGFDSFETKSINFLGVKGDLGHPKALTQESLSNSEFWNYDEFPLGVIEKSVQIPAQGTHKMVFLLGMGRDKADVTRIVDQYNSADKAEKALHEVKDYYKEMVGNSVQIETPDKENDRIINIWSQYHWRQTFKKDLDTGSLGAGFWAYGLEGGGLTLYPELLMMGHDDAFLKNSLKDILFANQNPDVSKNTIHMAPPAMLDSDLKIGWPPEKIPEGHSVPHHHYIYTQLFGLYYYLLESGDLKILEEEVGYLDGSSGTVFDHVEKAFDITLKGIGDRGLYKIPKNSGDWMDEFTKISRSGDAESVMLSAQVAFLLKNYAGIARRIGQEEIATQWMTVYERLKAAINEYAWDGDWYIRAFADNPENHQPVGSDSNQEGKIYLNAQSWMILADIAPTERAEKALSAVDTHLSSEFGPLVFSPSYTEFVEYIGTQSIYAPGFRNGNIYFRPAGWAVMAAALEGNAEQANSLYQSASLSNRSKDMDRYLLEPFAYPENYVGPDHAHRGEGQFHWCFGEGTAWMWFSYVNHILGIRAEIDGLVVDPHIPEEWDTYSVKKHFRGTEYRIVVQNPEHVSEGIQWIKVNGKKIKGNKIPILPASDKAVAVEVRMGK